MLKLPVKPPIVNENIDLSEYAKKSDVDAIGTSLGNKAEKKEVEKINSQLDTLTKKVDDEIKEIQSTTDTFKENINTSFNEFSNEQQNNFEALREEVLSDIEASYVGYDNEQHHNLESRLYSDFDKINQRFNNNSYLKYEGISIKANNTYYGLIKDTVIKGRTLQNIVKSYKPSEFQMLHAEMVSEGVFKLPEGESVNHTNVQARARNHMYKPNTTYTVFVDILENTTSKKLGISNINSMISPGYGRDFQNLIGVSCVKFTTSANGLSPQGTPPALGIYFGIWNANDTSGEFSKYIKFKYWILEGDHTNTPIEELPFVEGIQGTGDTTKNLIDLNTLKYGKFIEATNGQEQEHDAGMCTDYIEVNSSEEYILTGIYDQVFCMVSYYDSSCNYIGRTSANALTQLRLQKATGTTSNNGDYRGNIFPTNAKYIRFTEYRNSTVNANVNIEMIKTNTKALQLEEGSTATSYEPYFSGYKVSGKSCGKNLINHNKWSKSSEATVNDNNDGSFTLTTTLPWRGLLFKDIILKSNTTYTVNCKSSQTDIGVYIRIKQKDGSYNTQANWGGKFPAVFTTSDNAPIVQVSIETITPLKDVIISDIQLEENTVATTYEPYQESTYSYILDRPLMQLPNGVADSIDLETGVLTRRVGEYTVTGLETGELSSTADGTLKFAELDMSHVNVKYEENYSYEKQVCDNFKIANPYGHNENALWLFTYIGTKEKKMRVSLTKSVTTLKEIMDYLKANPTTVYYELAEPITEQLTPTQLKSFEGTTHIMSNNTLQARTSVKIHSYVQAVVTNLINENKALRSNVDILNVENEGLKETNEVQDELIDINMMATDEVYTMIEPLLASQPMSMERGMSKLVDMYVAMVQRGLKTIDQVPIRYRAEVQAILEALEK